MKKVFLVILLFVLIVLLGFFSVNYVLLKNSPSFSPVIHKDITLTSSPPLSISSSTTPASSVIPELPSRKWMNVTEQIVKDQQLAPPTAARFYAYVTTAYFETLKITRDEQFADYAVEQMIQQIYPQIHSKNYFIPSTSTSVSTTLSDNYLTGQTWLADLLEREKNDGFYALSWDGKIPKGNGLWRLPTKHPGWPTTPRAGDWKRWIISDKKFNVSLPPLFGSEKYQQEIAQTEKVLNKQSALNTLPSIPQAEKLSNFWQEKLWNAFKQEQSHQKPSSTMNLKFAYLQMMLAQGIADAFIECWKIKFTHWTAPPFMVINTSTAPALIWHHPSFPSEHTTVSRTAAEILGTFFPQQKIEFLQEAKHVGENQFLLGLQFKNDTHEGLLLGEAIGKEVIKNINLLE